MTAAPANAGQHQLVYRQPSDEEPLSTLTLGPVVLWLDGDQEVVIVEVPPGYEMSVVGNGHAMAPLGTSENGRSEP